MKVDVVGTEGVLWSGEADSVVVPAFGGELGVLAGREPVLAVLQAGTVRVSARGGETVKVDVRQGFLSVDEDQVTVVVDSSTDSALGAIVGDLRGADGAAGEGTATQGAAGDEARG